MSSVIEGREAAGAASCPSTAEVAAEPPVTVIEPRPGWRVVDPWELWRYRELFVILAARDVKVRYKQTTLGAAWALIQPLATMAVFAAVLGPLAGEAPGGPPYPLYVLAGLLPWTLFASSFNAAAASVVGNQSLVTKVYFPRLVIPASALGAPLVDFVISSALLLGLMAYQGASPKPGLVLAVPIATSLLLAALGVGSLLAALTVRYRDFRHVVPFLTQLWMFATPVIYLRPESLAPRLRWLLPLNPAYGLIGAFRQSVLGGPVDVAATFGSLASTTFLLVLGLAYFRRVERDFADVI